MADTVRTLSALQTLLADNTSGDISPQDVRDFLVSVYGLDYSTEVSVTTTATLTIGQRHVCSGTSADYTVTLPAASGNAGQRLQVRMASGLTKLVTVDGNSTELIDGSQTRVMWANEVAVLECDGTGWTKISGKSVPMFCSTKRAAIQSISNNTETKIALDTVNAESPAGQADVTTNDRINIKRPATYFITAAAIFNLAATSGNNQAYFKINGTKYTLVPIVPSVGATAPGPCMTVPVSLVAGDYVELGVFQLSGATRDTIGGTEFLITQEVVQW